MKKSLISILFIMFTTNFIPQVNAASVELEFSNGIIVSFDDTITHTDNTIPNQSQHHYQLGTSTITGHSSDFNDPTSHSNYIIDFNDNNNNNDLVFFSTSKFDNGSFLNQLQSVDSSFVFTNNIITSLINTLNIIDAYIFEWNNPLLNSTFGSELTTLTQIKVNGVTVPTPNTLILLTISLFGLTITRKSLT